MRGFLACSFLAFRLSWLPCGVCAFVVLAFCEAILGFGGCGSLLIWGLGSRLYIVQCGWTGVFALSSRARRAPGLRVGHVPLPFTSLQAFKSTSLQAMKRKPKSQMLASFPAPSSLFNVLAQFRVGCLPWPSIPLPLPIEPTLTVFCIAESAKIPMPL